MIINRIFSRGWIHFFIVPFLLICSTQTFSQHQEHKNDTKDKYHGMRFTPTLLEELKELRKTSDDAEEKLYGSWESVIPEEEGAAVGRILGMQTVHNVLLPSGKILMSSGSSWRNYKDIQYYPLYDNPAPAMGLFNYYDDPFQNSIRQMGEESNIPNYRKENYYQLVNNTAIYDPADNSFYRVPHPVPVNDPLRENHFVPSDLFCSGHLQLPDGNPLFIGGTQYYFPYRTGTNSTFIFDWKQEEKINWKEVDWRKMPKTKDNPEYPWVFSGFMERGRWYPSIVPLPDGRFTIFSGFVGFDANYGDSMYRFQINNFIEFFDFNKWDPNNPQAAWKAVNVQDKENGPFQTLINKDFSGGECSEPEFQPYWESLSCVNDFPLPCDCDEECIESNKYDAFKLYPNNYLVEKNRIYLTREGDWVSLRTSDIAYMRDTKITYYMDIEGTTENPDVSFFHGPSRQDNVTSYGTSYQDPNTNNITIIGGQPNSPGTLLPLDSKKASHFAGGLGSRKREQFWFNDGMLKDQEWTQEDDFLGTEVEDNRTMLTAIILPTKQVLIINGGNYDFYGPVLYPILLTPEFDEDGNFISYDKRRMSAAVEPRLYHNAALLLPNGKVWVSGGNGARASVGKRPEPPTNQNRNGQPKPDLDRVDVDMYFFRDGQMAKAQKGMQYTPTENWTAEIFSPPYIHIDSGRTVKVKCLERPKSKLKTTFSKDIEGKTYYLLSSDMEYELQLDSLPEVAGDKAPSVVLLKLPSFTHNWDMGQKFIELEITEQSESRGKLKFKTPNMEEENIPPGYYMLFYVDSKGKPSISQMVRFDDKATEP